MLEVFSGDPFLARRAFLIARAAAVARGDDVLRLGLGSDPQALRDALAHGGLFGPPTVALDLDEAVTAGGAAGTAARAVYLDVLEASGLAGTDREAAGAPRSVLVLDSGAPAGRQKRYRGLGTLHHTPTPRYGALTRWVQAELRARAVATNGDVAGALVDMFGEDLPALAAEIDKLTIVAEPLDPERVRRLVNRPAARSAFDLVDAVVAGDAATALAVARLLVDAGEPPVRVLGALGWQLDLIARVLALAQHRAGIAADEAAALLRTSPFPTRKALAVAARLDERALLELVDAFVQADERAKGGGDPAWQLEACVLSLCAVMRPAQAPRRTKAASNAAALGGKSSDRQ